MIQYSDSSDEEEGPGAMTSASPGASSGRGSQSDDSRAKVRFRYSRGTGGRSVTAMQQCMMGNDTNFDMLMFSHQDRNNRMS